MFIYVIFLAFSCLQNPAKMIPITKVDHFWINPCGLDKEPLNKDCGINTILNKAIINKTIQYCLLDTHKALEDAKKLQVYLKARHPSIDIAGNEDIKLFQFLKVSEDTHDPCNANSTIPTEYNLVQRHAVALQQMMEDAENDEEYYEHLKEKKRSMGNVLCSLHELILHLHIRRMTDITEDIMPVELRQNKPSTIIIRDKIVAQLYIYRMRHLDRILRDMQMHL